MNMDDEREEDAQETDHGPDPDAEGASTPDEVAGKDQAEG